MKTPTWEPAPGQLLTFLNSWRTLRFAELYTFATADAQAFRFTSGDRLISVNGNAFALGPKIERSQVRLSVGIEVDTLNVDLHAEPAVMLGALPLVQAFAQGLLDNGTLRVERLYLDNSNAQQGTLLVFAGRIGQVVTTRGHVAVEVLSHTELLDVMLPSGVYQPSCRNTLYDLFCGVSRAAQAISRTVTAGSGAARRQFNADFTASAGTADGWFTLGVVKFTSGANAGISRTVKRHTGAGGLVEVINPWPYVVAGGDAFDAWPGCDKTMATCTAKFANLQRFQGEPFVPLPETVT